MAQKWLHILVHPVNGVRDAYAIERESKWEVDAESESRWFCSWQQLVCCKSPSQSMLACFTYVRQIGDVFQSIDNRRVSTPTRSLERQISALRLCGGVVVVFVWNTRPVVPRFVVDPSATSLSASYIFVPVLFIAKSAIVLTYLSVSLCMCVDKSESYFGDISVCEYFGRCLFCSFVSLSQQNVVASRSVSLWQRHSRTQQC